jgi:nickel/cobalt transporter (NicO) family protein
MIGRTVPLRRRIAWAIVLAGGLIVVLPGIALAHPLGNFTVNHYAGIQVEPDRIVVDLVIDEAEIPTFQDRLRIDTDGDGVISDDEANVERLAACPRLIPDLALGVDGQRLGLSVFESGLSFLPGTAGLSTMRLVCEFSAGLPDTTAWPARITFDDSSHAGRIGWHEVVVTGSGVTLDLGLLPGRSVSDRLRNYPANLIPHPLAVQNVAFTAELGGPFSSYVPPADAFALTASAAEVAGDAPAESEPAASPAPASNGNQALGVGSTGGAPPAPPTAGPGSGSGDQAAVPGGVVGIDIGGLIESEAITPLVLFGALAAAFLLGAGHALTPGHGKTLMGAYLVGSRGTALHAIALGLAVTVSHTLGIVVLAAIILQARSVAPELFNTVAPIASGATVIAIGAWLLLGQLRQYRARRQERQAGHGARDEAGSAVEPHPHRHDALGRHIDADDDGAAAPIGWRSLFVLGLAGGLIPSTNALIILLAAINVDRPAYGLVLVVAFGLGMATVLGGVGLVLVFARDRLDRMPSASSLGRLATYAPLGAACLIFSLGIWLTSQAIGTGPAF